MSHLEELVRVAEEAFHRVHGEEIPIAIVGDLILDVAVEGVPGGIHPETNVELLKDASVQESIGGAGNVALILARLGVHVTLFGLVGHDLPGRQLSEMLERQRYESYLVHQRDWPTPRKEWIYKRDGTNLEPVLRIDYDQPLPGSGRKELLGEFRARHRRDTRVLVVADHGLGAMGTETGKIIELAQKVGAKVVAIPRTALAQYEKADALVPNPTEMRQRMGLHGKGPAKKEADAFAKKYGLTVYLTQGREGIYVATTEPKGSHLSPTQSVPNPQKMGARDMALAVVALGLALELPPADTALLANGFATLVVRQRGTGVVHWEDLFRSLGRETPARLTA
ncbi:MAG: bifunctional heptose 7-phosphate kinase/heptose 1-phosphate adenyltransferase [Pirellulales bacterium]